MIANSGTKQLLKHHLKAVGLLSYGIGKKLFPALSDSYLNILLLSGLLHDTGKANPAFQAFLSSKDKSDPSDIERLEDQQARSGNWSFHNEESWFFTCTSLRGVFQEDLELLSWLVYHHHAPRKRNGEVSTSAELAFNLQGRNKKLSDSPASTAIAESMTDAIKEYNLLTNCNYSFLKTDALPGSVPQLHHFLLQNKHEINALARLLQSILCTADRKISSLSKESVATIADINSLDEAVTYLSDLGLIPDHSGKSLSLVFDSSDRTKLQRGLATDAMRANTSIVDAGPGLGKTRTALDYLDQTGSTRHYIFVVPRNSVGESLFSSTVSDLAALGNTTTSVELFLGGEVVKRHALPESSEGFTANIIITNVDNALNPFMKHTNIDRLITLYLSPIAADEFHEVPGDSAMFALFNVLVYGRNLIGSKTILVSATPIEQMATFFGIDDINIASTDTLAFDNEIQCLYTESYEEARAFVDNTGISIFNSRTTAQREHQAGNSDLIIHGGYSDQHKSQLINTVMDLFGRANYQKNKHITIVASGIIQASFNVHFYSMIDSIISPEATIQRIGRLGRFDSDPCKLVFWGSSNKSETAAAGEIYDNKLRKLWMDVLKTRFSSAKKVKKSELIALYKLFKKTYESEIYEYVLEKHTNSIRNVGKLDFFVGGRKRQGDKKRIGKNLRGSNGCFVLMPVVGGADSHITLSVDDTYLRELKDRYESNFNGAKKAMLAVDQVGVNYGTKKGFEKKKLKDIMRDAKCEETPLVAQLADESVIIYHMLGANPGLGIITKSDLINLIT